MSELGSREKLKKLCQKLIDRRQRNVSKWEGVVQQFVEKVREEHTGTSCEQLGIAIYELNCSKFLLGELKRIQKQLARVAPANSHRPVSQSAPLPV